MYFSILIKFNIPSDSVFFEIFYNVTVNQDSIFGCYYCNVYEELFIYL